MYKVHNNNYLQLNVKYICTSLRRCVNYKGCSSSTSTERCDCVCNILEHAHQKVDLVDEKFFLCVR